MSQELDVDKFTAIVVETLEDASFVFADPDPEADACGPQLGAGRASVYGQASRRGGVCAVQWGLEPRSLPTCSMSIQRVRRPGRRGQVR